MRNTASMGTTKKSLAQTHPALAKEAYGWDPKTVTAGSNLKKEWICQRDQDKRLKTHRNLGWVVLDTRGPLQGDVTHEWEQSIIRALKKSGAIFDADKVAGKYTGYSESWRKDSCPAEKIIDLMEFVKDFEERSK